MIVKDKKSELSESAQEKLRVIVEQAVEKKLQKEVKKVARKLTIRFIISGVALTGAFLIVNNTDKIISLLKNNKEK